MSAFPPPPAPPTVACLAVPGPPRRAAVVRPTAVPFSQHRLVQSGNGYADTTGYTPVNTWDRVNDRWRWQPSDVEKVRAEYWADGPG